MIYVIVRKSGELYAGDAIVTCRYLEYCNTELKCVVGLSELIYVFRSFECSVLKFQNLGSKNYFYINNEQ